LSTAPLQCRPPANPTAGVKGSAAVAKKADRTAYWNSHGQVTTLPVAIPDAEILADRLACRCTVRCGWTIHLTAKVFCHYCENEALQYTLGSDVKYWPFRKNVTFLQLFVISPLRDLHFIRIASVYLFCSSAV